MKTLWNKYSYAIILVILSILASIILVISSGESVEEKYMSVTINEGETLWDLCQNYADKHALSETEFVSWVEEINDINGNVLLVGDEIYIPVELNDSAVTELASN
ncbi:Cell division suppressor protein YneA [Mycobacteroides abscessus subsp. abscessus]|nr:Cell division suppressor protein YneA [Mycobacteroides abscessus subsp. abscessus]